jgi:hypothetical protein
MIHYNRMILQNYCRLRRIFQVAFQQDLLIWMPWPDFLESSSGAILLGNRCGEEFANLCTGSTIAGLLP